MAPLFARIRKGCEGLRPTKPGSDGDHPAERQLLEEIRHGSSSVHGRTPVVFVRVQRVWVESRDSPRRVGDRREAHARQSVPEASIQAFSEARPHRGAAKDDTLPLRAVTEPSQAARLRWGPKPPE